MTFALNLIPGNARKPGLISHSFYKFKHRRSSVVLGLFLFLGTFMNLTKTLTNMLMYGVDPVLYFLILMSIISIAIIIERLLSFSHIEQNLGNYNATQIRLSLEKRLGILATFGNNAPFIGLFGTILGVMNAFASLGSSNDISTKIVMVGISEALVATAMGLLVAIPSVAAYNYFVRRMRKILLTAGEA